MNFSPFIRLAKLPRSAKFLRLDLMAICRSTLAVELSRNVRSKLLRSHLNEWSRQTSCSFVDSSNVHRLSVPLDNWQLVLSGCRR